MEALWFAIVGNNGSGTGVLRFLLAVIVVLAAAFVVLNLAMI